MGKIIVIEGTDSSGKETQSKILKERFEKEGIKTGYLSFPRYESPTGKIIGGPYLGKQSIGECVFPEGAANVNPKVASLFFAADRLYHLPEIEEKRKNQHLILDRYVYSNMAHQGGKIKEKTEREKLYQRIDQLEFGFLNLPQADIKIFLHMPIEQTIKLQKKRSELDQHEKDRNHLENAEKAYIEVAKRYQFQTLECYDSTKGEIKTIETIHNEIYAFLKNLGV